MRKATFWMIEPPLLHQKLLRKATFQMSHRSLIKGVLGEKRYVEWMSHCSFITGFWEKRHSEWAVILYHRFLRKVTFQLCHCSFTRGSIRKARFRIIKPLFLSSSSLVSKKSDISTVPRLSPQGLPMKVGPESDISNEPLFLLQGVSRIRILYPSGLRVGSQGVTAQR